MTMIASEIPNRRRSARKCPEPATDQERQKHPGSGDKELMTSDDTVNILLVDDQPAKLLSYETILSGLGENLIKAASAREALEHLLKDPGRVEDAERAMADFRARAEAAHTERNAERDALLGRVAELKTRGEDVASVERALDRGLAEGRKALEDLEKMLKVRDLQNTWQGIKSKLAIGDKPPVAVTPRPEVKAPPETGEGEPKPAEVRTVRKIPKKKGLKK
jgi:CheY-like chemotaxis protein